MRSSLISTLAEDAEDEYVISSQRKIDGKTVYVYALNGKLRFDC